MNTTNLNSQNSNLKPKEIHWSATKFFRRLTESNKLARKLGFRFCRVSGLTGFEEAVTAMQNTTAFVCVSDISMGTSSMDNTPHMEKVKTVFLAMRHPIDDLTGREWCMKIMHELFRQFMSVLIKEKTKLEQDCIYVDERITFREIDQYFFSGCAAAYFQITVQKYVDLRFNEDEWEPPTITEKK
ncbi:MAG: hypothetical protein IKR05_08410 [Prevotella sp.]|nr:hypothetical protein [Prevotella sp.]